MDRLLTCPGEERGKDMVRGRGGEPTGLARSVDFILASGDSNGLSEVDTRLAPPSFFPVW